MHLAVAVNSPTLALFYAMPISRWGHDYPPHRMPRAAQCPAGVRARHVPADVMTRLLQERPAILGLAVPGMPVGEFSRARIDATVNELKEEKSLVAELLPQS